MTKTISAGLVVYRKNDNKVEIFLVHPGGPFFVNKEDGVWSIPKGEVENPERNDFLEDAIREYQEEVGCNLSTTDFIELGSVKQPSGKVIHAWAVEQDLQGPFISNNFTLEWPPKSGRTQDFPEVDRWQYFSPDVAKLKLSGKQSELIDRLLKKLNLS